MKKYLTIVLLTCGLMAFTPAYALDGEGTIEDFMICGSGEKYWKSYVMFKLSDGNWFGLYGQWDAMGDSPSYSTVILALSNKWPLSVRANYSLRTHCGVSAMFFWNSRDDYIKINFPG